MALLASALGTRRGGGVFVVGDGQAERLDTVATGGMSVTPDGARLVRSLGTGQAGGGGAELLVHDRRGVVAYHRLDLALDVHDVLARDHDVLVVSTGSNGIVAVDGGHERVEWQAPGGGDAWHLNSLVADGDRLLVSAFGRFDVHRGWASHGPDGRFAAAGRGEVVDVASGATVLGGLSMPHDPRRLADGWLLCESLRGAVVRFDEEGRPRRSVELGGFTRGVVVDGDVVHVGLSANRHLEGAGLDRAEVVTLDLDDLSVLGRVPLPADEIYALVRVDDVLVDGVATGLRTNRGRAREQARWVLFEAMGLEPDHLWTDGDPLAPERWRSTIEVDGVPATVVAGGRLLLPCRLVNTSGVPLASVQPHPVRVGGRWVDADGGDDLLAASRADLVGTLPPGGTATLVLDCPVPGRPGRWDLVVGVLQEQVAWFGAADPAAEARFTVEVVGG